MTLQLPAINIIVPHLNLVLTSDTPITVPVQSVALTSDIPVPVNEVSVFKYEVFIKNVQIGELFICPKSTIKFDKIPKKLNDGYIIESNIVNCAIEDSKIVRSHCIESDILDGTVTRSSVYHSGIEQGTNLIGCAVDYSNLYKTVLNNTSVYKSFVHKVNSTNQYARSYIRRSEVRNIDIVEPVCIDYLDLSATNMFADQVEIRKTPRVLLGLEWPITVFDDYMQIGCQRHRIKNWFKFETEDFDEMSEFAAEFWEKHKDLIRNFIDATK